MQKLYSISLLLLLWFDIIKYYHTEGKEEEEEFRRNSKRQWSEQGPTLRGWRMCGMNSYEENRKRTHRKIVINKIIISCEMFGVGHILILSPYIDYGDWAPLSHFAHSFRHNLQNIFTKLFIKIFNKYLISIKSECKSKQYHKKEMKTQLNQIFVFH